MNIPNAPANSSLYTPLPKDTSINPSERGLGCKDVKAVTVARPEYISFSKLSILLSTLSMSWAYTFVLFCVYEKLFIPFAIGDKVISLETGYFANQADGAVMAKCGGTVVMCVVCTAKEDSPDTDFFPLTVNYIEKAYACGKIPGGFFKREGKQSEREAIFRPCYYRIIHKRTNI